MRTKEFWISALAALGLSVFGLPALANAAMLTAAGAGHDRIVQPKSDVTPVARFAARGRVGVGRVGVFATGHRLGMGRVGYGVGLYAGHRFHHARYWGGRWGWRRPFYGAGLGWGYGYGWNRPYYRVGWRRRGWYGGWGGGWPFLGVGLGWGGGWGWPGYGWGGGLGWPVGYRSCGYPGWGFGF